MHFSVSLAKTLSDHIAVASGKPFRDMHATEVGGGCINRAYVVTSTNGQRYFIKLNTSDRLNLFESEADGLKALAKTAALAVPQPLCLGTSETSAFLVLDYLDLSGSQDTAAAHLGRAVAALHRTTSERFGWHRDNHIGSTEQANAWHDDWTEFFAECRLRPQLRLACAHGASLLDLGQSLIEALPALFTGYRARPALVHGDLWGGNVGVTATGVPAVFDPAVYFGDRETDLAMTELFGGFSRRFHDAYRESWPLADGYAVRKILYQLYHVLNHFNLFGGGYGAQAQKMMQQLLSEVR